MIQRKKLWVNSIRHEEGRTCVILSDGSELCGITEVSGSLMSEDSLPEFHISGYLQTVIVETS